MTHIRVERSDYAPTYAPLGRSETAEHAAKRLRALYPDIRALALVVASPLGRRVERFL